MGSVQVGSGWLSAHLPTGLSPRGPCSGGLSGVCSLAPALSAAQLARCGASSDPPPTSPLRWAEPAEGWPRDKLRLQAHSTQLSPHAWSEGATRGRSGRADLPLLCACAAHRALGAGAREASWTLAATASQASTASAFWGCNGVWGPGLELILQTLLRSQHHCRGSRLLCEDGCPVLWVPHSRTCPQVPPLPARVGSTAGRVFQGPRAWGGGGRGLKKDLEPLRGILASPWRGACPGPREPDRPLNREGVGRGCGEGHGELGGRRCRVGAGLRAGPTSAQ